MYVVCWAVWALAHFATMDYWDMNWQDALIDSLISNFLLAAACLLIINNLRFYRPGKNRPMYILVLCVTIAGCWLVLTDFLLETFIPENISFIENSLPVRFNIGFLLTGCSAMISLLWYHTEEQRENLQLKSETETLAKDAELYSLRQQLQPHFLFNSLNSISSLVGSDPELSRKMIHQLSGFLRGTLNKEDTARISITEELEHLELYLDIEKVRFGHRLHTAIQLDNPLATIPPMILQPIVENAIKFGLYDTIGTVRIDIKAAITDDHLVITVTNPYDPETADPKKGTGFGLSSIRRRLYLLFSRNDLLSTAYNKSEFITTVKIPQQDDQSNNH